MISVRQTAASPAPWLRRLFDETPGELGPGSSLAVEFPSSAAARRAQRWLWLERRRRKRDILAQDGSLDPDAADPWRGLVTWLQRRSSGECALVIERPETPTASISDPDGKRRTLDLDNDR